jgi:hypothetical protein
MGTSFHPLSRIGKYVARPTRRRARGQPSQKQADSVDVFPTRRCRRPGGPCAIESFPEAKSAPPDTGAGVEWPFLSGGIEAMSILLIVLGGVALLAVVGAAVGYYLIKKYLTRSQEGVHSTMSDIVEEIDSYQEKTQ